MTHSATPWKYRVMTKTIAIKAADGSTVCNLPIQKDRERRLANAKLICQSANERLIEGLRGAPSSDATAESQADPRNPNT
mgnify:CR=1 FL=1